MGTLALGGAAAGQGKPPVDRNVLHVQVILDHLGFSPGILDGRPGQSLNAALKAFQETRGLAETGEIDPPTLRALNPYHSWRPTKSLRLSAAVLQGPFAPIPRDAAEQSKLLRGHLAATAPGFEADGEGKGVYRTFAAYARDKIITENAEAREIVERQLGRQAVQDAQERLLRMSSLMRAPEHTLSSDVGGLLPPTHISQIMDIIDTSRPVVSSANRVDLSSGSLTWPKVTQRPLVHYQTTEKTEGNTRKMTVEMKNAAAFWIAS